MTTGSTDWYYFFHQISIFARHGTLRTKIVLGEYFGYPIMSKTGSNEVSAEVGDAAAREMYMNQMYDDLFCEYGIACSRLESLLNSVEPGVFSSWESGSRSDVAIVNQAYQTCMNLKLRLNFLNRSLLRMTSWRVGSCQLNKKNIQESMDTVLSFAPYGKLKVISDSLVHVLVSLFGVEVPIDGAMIKWTHDLTLETCKSLFTTFCVKGSSSSRARVGAVILRTCGEKKWWGEFLAWVMETFFCQEQKLMFSQER